MDVLQSIIAKRRTDVEAAIRAVPAAKLRPDAEKRVHHSLAAALASGAGTRVIAEVKKASPSGGVFSRDYQPAVTAAGYQGAGAIAVSVLTEPHRFHGSDAHLRQVRDTVQLPVLRKDFIFDRYQVLESAALGADAILLIVAALDQDILVKFYAEALSYQLDVLVEAHTREELDRALKLEKAIIGVNNRNLRNLTTNLSVSRELAGLIPPDRLAISESGIRTRADIVDLEKHGYKGFLIGEVLMSAPDPAGKLRELTGSL